MMVMPVKLPTGAYAALNKGFKKYWQQQDWYDFNFDG